ncbi:MAG: hypothetical protein KGL39_24365 [Patescibacteria group bacterium]|nr:hypothetical protein [Patescibacteria group bacterium]
MPDYQNPGSSNIVNCIPRTPTSYGPFSSLQAVGGALSNRCQGAFSCSDSGANNYVFCGDSTKLYNYTSASTSANDISNGTYSTSADGFWKFLLFGQRVVASNYNNAMQSFILGSSTTFSDLANGNITALTLVAGSGYTNGTYALTVTNPGSGTGFAGTVTVSGGSLTSYTITNVGSLYPQTATISIPSGAGSGTGGSITPTIQTIAPKARYIDVAKGFLIAGNTYDETYGAQPQRVWWSALNDPTNWPTPGTTTAATYQSSYNDLLGNGGWITGVVGNLGTADVAVFLEREVWRGVYSGPPLTFEWFPAEGVRGTRAPNSLVHMGPFVYYLGEDGFYVFDGTSSQSIGAEKVDKTFFSKLDQNYFDRIYGAADPLNKVIYWVYPSVSANGIPDSVLIYNWFLQKWSSASLNIEVLMRAQTFGYTLDSVPGTFDQWSVPFDSRQWTGGSIIFAGFDNTHSLAFFNGPSLEATIETTETSPFDGYYAQLTDCRPLIDGGTPTVSFGYRNRLIDTQVYNSGTTINSIGTCPQIVNGKYLRGKIVIPAGDTWTHFQGIETNVRRNGAQ